MSDNTQTKNSLTKHSTNIPAHSPTRVDQRLTETEKEIKRLKTIIDQLTNDLASLREEAGY
jgi:archaellum component FlaC